MENLHISNKLPGITSANDALTISLVAPSEGSHTTLHKFHPAFTYPLFGDEEKIFGYQNLRIDLKYNASDLRPNVQISYKKKYKAVGETEPDDVKEVLKEYLDDRECLAIGQ
jgi:histone acetyltransferase 1